MNAFHSDTHPTLQPSAAEQARERGPSGILSRAFFAVVLGLVASFAPACGDDDGGGTPSADEVVSACEQGCEQDLCAPDDIDSCKSFCELSVLILECENVNEILEYAESCNEEATCEDQTACGEASPDCA